MNYTKEEIKELILQYQDKYKMKPFYNTDNGLIANWEYELLMFLNAINKKGEIKYNYPVVKIQKKDEETAYEDLGGNMFQTRQAVNDFNSENKKEKAEIYFYPKYYILFNDAHKELLAFEHLMLSNTPITKEEIKENNKNRIKEIIMGFKNHFIGREISITSQNMLNNMLKRNEQIF
jgi:hypothetical protein